MIAKKAGLRLSRGHRTAKEMLPEIPRSIILHIYGAFSPEDISLKLLVQVKPQESIILFAKSQKENEQSRLSF